MGYIDDLHSRDILIESNFAAPAPQTPYATYARSRFYSSRVGASNSLVSENAAEIRRRRARSEMLESLPTEDRPINTRPNRQSAALDASLREVLGDHIDQRGSLVAPTKLRFDFSHKSQIPLPELSKIESLSIDWVKKNVKVFSKELDLKTAQRIPGLRAVFGESYPDPVRVVTLEYDVEEI